jgi:hypothetical protein
MDSFPVLFTLSPSASSNEDDLSLGPFSNSYDSSLASFMPSPFEFSEEKMAGDGLPVCWDDANKGVSWCVIA